MQKITAVCKSVLLGVAALWSGIAHAADPAASAWTTTDQTQVRLIAAAAATGSKPDLRLGLEFKLKPGWKVYWRSPGDAGFPPRLDWAGSNNLTVAAINWPAPARFSVLGLETLGYKKHVIFPITAKVTRQDEAAAFRTRVRYLTCNDICIPYEAKLSLNLPAGTATPSPHAHDIDRFVASVPGDGRAHGLTVEKLESWRRGAKIGLRVLAKADAPFTAPDVFLEGAAGLAYGKPRVTLSDDRRQAELTVEVDGLDGLDDDKGKTLDLRPFVVTLVDRGRAAEQTHTATPGSPGSPGPKIIAAAPGLLTILALAVLGGLILNLMPCVLPVLSLKLLSVVSHGGGERRQVRFGFLASAAGIIAAFLVLAGALAGLKAGGAVIGWGIQFQQPWFLISLTALIMLFACNLWGFFEVRLPGAIGDAGLAAGHAEGLAGHFLQGAFATLLATPCSAPFLGTAVGFALAGDTVSIMLVFAALGVGLALPYFAIAAFPALATRLPKPGPWMVRLKFVLAFALVATGVWLISVLAGVTGSATALAVGGVMTASALVLYLAHRPKGPGLKASAPALAAALAISIALPAWLPAAEIDKDVELAGIWKPFDEAAIPGLVANGKTVFVDVTADWCITCLVNKGVVLKNQRVRSLLEQGQVVAMQADWTKPNDAIANYLARYGRYGIPFNIVYGPKAPKGIVLPELLSGGGVLAAFDRAAAPGSLVAGK